MDPKRPQLPEHPANKHGGVPQRPDTFTAPGAPPPHHPSPAGGGGGYQMGGFNNYRGGPPMYGELWTEVTSQWY